MAVTESWQWPGTESWLWSKICAKVYRTLASPFDQPTNNHASCPALDHASPPVEDWSCPKNSKNAVPVALSSSSRSRGGPAPVSLSSPKKPARADKEDSSLQDVSHSSAWKVKVNAELWESCKEAARADYEDSSLQDVSHSSAWKVKVKQGPSLTPSGVSRGDGIFLAQPVKKGQLLLEEKPVFTLFAFPWSTLWMWASVLSLSKEKRAAVMALSTGSEEGRARWRWDFFESGTSLRGGGGKLKRFWENYCSYWRKTLCMSVCALYDREKSWKKSQPKKSSTMRVTSFLTKTIAANNKCIPKKFFRLR